LKLLTIKKESNENNKPCTVKRREKKEKKRERNDSENENDDVSHK